MGYGVYSICTSTSKKNLLTVKENRVTQVDFDWTFRNFCYEFCSGSIFHKSLIILFFSVKSLIQACFTIFYRNQKFWFKIFSCHFLFFRFRPRPTTDCLHNFWNPPVCYHQLSGEAEEDPGSWSIYKVLTFWPAKFCFISQVLFTWSQ